MGDVWFEDLEVGSQERSGEQVADHDEMVAYALRNDPWPIHIDDAAAAETPLGGVIASFGYTVSLVLRAIHELPSNVEGGANDAFLGAVGWNVGFKGPVRAGDRVHVVTTLTDKRLASKGDRGVVTERIDLINHHGDVVLTIDATSIVLCRPA